MGYSPWGLKELDTSEHIISDGSTMAFRTFFLFQEVAPKVKLVASPAGDGSWGSVGVCMRNWHQSGRFGLEPQTLEMLMAWWKEPHLEVVCGCAPC